MLLSNKEAVMAHVLQMVAELLSKGKGLVLARIIRQVGSAPRSTGTACIVLEDGSLIGTIGGGLLEYQTLERAKEVLKSGESTTLSFRLTGEDVKETDMLCVGLVDIYLEPLFPENRMVKEIFAKAGKLIGHGRRGALVTLISDGIPHGDDRCRALLLDDNVSIGSILGLDDHLDEKAGAFVDGRGPRLFELGEDGPSIFVEPISPARVLYLFGAGHVSSFVAPLARMVGYRVVVIDDRAEFANRDRFPHADDILVLPFSDAFGQLDVGGSSSIVIITRGHIFDREVLREALGFDVDYIGMIGSKRKVSAVHQSLIDEGYSREELARVHAPIGIDIGAETPEEIAVSIVAELIKTKTKKGNH
jgi:xanthine dehydrogenase accessory factor